MQIISIEQVLPYIYHIFGKTDEQLVHGLETLGMKIEDEEMTAQAAKIAQKRLARGESMVGGRITSLRDSSGKRYTLKFLIDDNQGTLNGEDKNVAEATLKCDWTL